MISELQCAHLLARYTHPTRAARGLVAAVERIGDVVDALRAWGGGAGGGPQVDMPEPAHARSLK